MTVNIYVDQIAEWVGDYRGADAVQARRVGARNNHRWCHLLADEADCPDLHAFAARIGMHREWFQRNHYDLTPGRRELAVRLGAIEIDRVRLVAILRAQRARCRP